MLDQDDEDTVRLGESRSVTRCSSCSKNFL